MNSYEIKQLDESLLYELKKRKLAWNGYTLTRRSVAVFPSNGEKPLIVTEDVWRNYFKPLWDKGIFTYSYNDAISSCSNPDMKWVNEYRTYDHLNEVYWDNPCANQKHTKYISSVSFERKEWTFNEREQFRKSGKWKSFTKLLKLKRNCVCDDCRRKFNIDDLEVHHLYSEDYGNLDESRFKVLCLHCHDTRHGYEEKRFVEPIKERKIKKIKKVKKD